MKKAHCRKSACQIFPGKNILPRLISSLTSAKFLCTLSSLQTDLNVNSSEYAYILSGGTANGTTIKSGGFLAVSGGGTAVDLNVNASGYVYVLGDGAAASRADVPGNCRLA